MKKKKLIFSVFLVMIFILSLNYFIKEETNIIYTPQKVIDDEKYNYTEEKESDNKTNNEKDETDSDIIGKITIDGTNINYEIVQGSDNEFFLNHSVTKEENIHGSVFMDYRNTLDDRKLLIYGHNSKTLKDALFHDLEKYLKKSFYEEHKYIDITINNKKSTWEIFSVMIVEENNNSHMKITFNDEEFIKHIDWMKEESLYNTNIEVGNTDKIITLQTCYYNPKNSYLIVNAKKVK